MIITTSRFAGRLGGLALGAAALLGVSVFSGKAEAAEHFSCPLHEARRTITNKLPNGWWTTPIVWSLTDTRIQRIGGKRTLVCVYGSSGTIQHKEPRHQRCEALSGGFRCVSAWASNITWTTLRAYPESYSGRCPAKITFKGAITTRGPTIVKYVFARSDGAHDTITKRLVFNGAGTKEVSTTWTLGGSSLPSYSGWEAIKTLSPVAKVWSKAPFKVRCVARIQR